MNLCFECSEYPPGLHGGIGSLTQILARGFTAMGHSVRVIGLYHPSCAALDYEEDGGVQIWRLRLPSIHLGWIQARRRLFSIISDWAHSGDIDLVEVPDWGAPAAGWRSLPVPVVARLSGSATFFSKEMGNRPPLREFLLERASLCRADFICSNSHYIASRTEHIFGLCSPVNEVIYTPVHVPELSAGIKRDANLVIFAGTLAEKKGVISLLKSWPAVIKAWPSAKLTLFGKDGKSPTGGSMQAHLRSLLPADIRQSVKFCGHVPLGDLLNNFQKAGVAVLPSYAEGFALTPLHAMAAGCPTIYSSRGSGSELVDDRNNGLLVDPDNIHQIASSIIALLRDQALAHRIGANGRQLVEQRFSWPVLSHQNEEFYRACVEQFTSRDRRKANALQRSAAEIG